MPGKGSTFTLYLPVRPHPQDAQRVDRPGNECFGRSETADRPVRPPTRCRPPATGADALNGARILIVDDDARSVFALTGVFERHGAEVLYAENGRVGIAALEHNEDISLVLMDVMMPELDGERDHAGDPADAAIH